MRNEDKMRFGAITEAAFGDHDPPGMIDEWEQQYQQPGDTVILWAGLTRYREESKLSWSWLYVHTPDGKPSPNIDEVTSAKVERLLSPLAHESRFRIVLALVQGPLSASALATASGLKGGNLYHHLRELLGASYVRESDQGYQLTDLGRQLTITVSQIANAIVQDRETDGLIVGDKW